MGLLGKFNRVHPPTLTDYVEKSEGSPLEASQDDPEKTGIFMKDNADTGEHHHHIHPDAERAVVRKLDWRVPPLVGALCTSASSTSTCKRLADIACDRSTQFPRQIKHWVSICL